MRPSSCEAVLFKNNGNDVSYQSHVSAILDAKSWILLFNEDCAVTSSVEVIGWMKAPQTWPGLCGTEFNAPVCLRTCV